MATQDGTATKEPHPPGEGGRRRLLTVQSCKHELADTVRGIKDGSIDPAKGRTLVYALSELIAAIKGSDLEAAVRRMERRSQGDTEATTQ